MNKIHYISAERLTIGRVAEIMDGGYTLALSDDAIERISRCRRYLDEKMETASEPIYGITTGFGSLCNISIDSTRLADLQRNLVMSHACSIGERVPDEIVRLMLLLKAQSLSYGNSGVQVETVQRLLDMFNLGIVPRVCDQGSLGASGDLSPLACLCLPILGLGDVYYKGELRPAAEVMDELGLAPVQLKSKEGLALLNGTQFMSAYGVWSVIRARRIGRLADRLAALSLDAFDGRIEPFSDPVNRVRHHRGQIETAAAVREMLRGSEIVARHKEHVQDPYSFRCVPQVHGAFKDTLAHVASVIEDEINAPTDNPTVFPELDMIVSAGNFHGEPIALPMDFLAVALSELANISERRVYCLISGKRGLPSFLVAKPGLNSGFMIPQYAAASIVSRNKGLCWPASCDSIPSSQGQEDHVSMGANSAVKLRQVVLNTYRVLGIELFNAAQALEFRRPLRSSPLIEDWVVRYRRLVPFVVNDTVMYPLIEKSVEFVTGDEDFN